MGPKGPAGPAPSGTGAVVVNNGVAKAVTVSGDGTLNAATGLLTVTKSNGTALAAVATSGSAGDLRTGALPHAQLPALVSGDIPTNAANTSGNAATATALANAPTLCTAGAYTLGINLAGNAQNCTALPAFPSGAIVGASDTQALTNKTVDGVSPITLGFLDATSSVQTQLNGKQAVGGPVVQKIANYLVTCADFTAVRNFQATASITFTLPTGCAGGSITVMPGAGVSAAFNLSTNSVTANAQSTLTTLGAGSGTSGYPGYVLAPNPALGSDFIVRNSTGATGATGAAGSAGVAGAAGPAGAIGATGAAGPTGATGATGSNGAAGTNGSNGAAGATGPAGPSGAGSSVSVITYRALSQNGIGGGNFDLIGAAGSLGTPANCSSPDAHNVNLDGACSFANGAANYVEGHFYACSTTVCGTAFVDGIKATITNWNTTATSGTAQFSFAVQCVAVGGLASASGYGTPTNWSAIAAQATASERNETNTLTMTSGCSADQEVYWYIALTNGLSAPALLKRFVISGTGIAQ